MQALTGVFVAAVTPLQADFSPDLEAVPHLLDFFAGRGAHGALLLGTTGEGPSFDPQERASIFRAALRVRESHPDFRLLAGTGTPSLSETAGLTRLAFDLGFDGAVVLPPYYYRKASQEGLFQYFQELLRRSVPADGRLLGYHFPEAAGIGFSLDLLERLKVSFPVQFAGLKDSSHEAGFAVQLGKRFGRDLAVFTGTDSLFQLALENQAAGCITAPANLLSQELRRVWDGFRAEEAAGPAQERLSALRHLLEKHPPFPPLLKALLARLHGLPLWPVRPPLVAAPAEAVEKVLAEWQPEVP
jgi:4-hydroxy-tetrahydrodipicolinate synthase